LNGGNCCRRADAAEAVAAERGRYLDDLRPYRPHRSRAACRAGTP